MRLMTVENSLRNDKQNKILLIDNYSRNLSTDRTTRIETIIKSSKAEVELKTIHFTQFNIEMAQQYIGIILSGSEQNVSSFYYEEVLKKKFKPQLDLKGRIDFILIKKTDELITQRNIPVDLHHLDFVSPNDCQIQENFEILSTSRTIGYKMVQYMKYIDKPIYALQFHPETHNPNFFNPTLFDERIVNITRIIGEEIIENFILLCLSNRKNIKKS